MNNSVRNFSIEKGHRKPQDLNMLWLQPDKKTAMKVAQLVMAEYKDRYPEAIKGRGDLPQRRLIRPASDKLPDRVFRGLVNEQKLYSAGKDRAVR